MLRLRITPNGVKITFLNDELDERNFMQQSTRLVVQGRENKYANFNILYMVLNTHLDNGI